MLALAEAVVSAETIEESHERGEDLLDASRHAAKLTEELLALERTKSMRPGEDQGPVDLSKGVSSVANELAPMCQAQGIKLTEETSAQTSLCRIDPTLFEQAITNHITNAMLHGGPSVSRIDLSVIASGRDIQVDVKDNGRGLDDKDFEAALSRFSQVSPAAGTGFGLPIAQAITEGASGALTLRKRSPGLCVRLVLPRVQQGQPAVAA